MWYTCVGASITIIVALIVSLLTGPNKIEDLNPKLFAPFIQRLFFTNVKKAKTLPTELTLKSNDSVTCISIINVSDLRDDSVNKVIEK
jgi:hypothetical protein